MGQFKEGTLACRWRRNHDGCGPDLVFFYPRSCDGHLLHHAINHVDVHSGNSLAKELERRGYDITTLRFTVRRKRKD